MTKKMNRYRRSPSGSDGIHVLLSARLLPADPNPVWIPTNPITLCLFTPPLRPLPPLLFPATSQTTRTVFGGEFVRHVRLGKTMAESPKMNPNSPIAREVRTIRDVDRRVEGDVRAWKSFSLGEDGMIFCNGQITDPVIRKLSEVYFVLTVVGLSVFSDQRSLCVWRRVN